MPECQVQGAGVDLVAMPSPLTEISHHLVVLQRRTFPHCHFLCLMVCNI